MKIAVIGAGIVGITTAYELAQDGHDITVFEQTNAAAEGASFANSGVIAPSCTLPFSSPDWTTPSNLHFFKSLQTLSIKNGVTLRDLQWLWGWGKASNGSTDSSTLCAAHALGTYSRQLMQDRARASNLEFESSEGHLLLLPTEAGFKAFQPKLATLKAHGVAFKELQPAEVSKVEPALNLSNPLHGAIHFPHDGVGNCRQFALLLKTAAQKMGVTFCFASTIVDIQTQSGPLLSIQGQTSPQAFDSVVVCTGEVTRFLRDRLKIKLPVALVQGYSLSAAIREPLNAPRSSIMDMETRIVIARIGNRIRISGGFELGGDLAVKDTKTVQGLFKALHHYFPGAVQHPEGTQVWKGTRPITTDGLPIIGGSEMPGIWLNLAHGANGWTNASAAARMLADQIRGKNPELDAAPFSAARFSSI